MDGSLAKAIAAAIESAADLRAEKVVIVRLHQGYDVETDVQTVRVELTYEIGETK